LDIWGIGPETADSILLYAFGVPVFVIDAYTKRFLSRMNPGFADYTYEHLQQFFTRSLPRDVELFQEFHALMVRHCKDVCRKQPECMQCDFTDFCSYGRSNSK